MIPPAFILSHTQMGENVGSAARAMKNFGLTDLRLIAPKMEWPNDRAQILASGAGDILERTQIHGDAKAALADTERRIQAIAQVHRRLYTSGDVESVDMDEYLKAIVEELQAAWSNPVSPRVIRLEAEALKLHTDKAVSLGVIVNELVSNACKYAYDIGQPGEVRVRFSRDQSADDERFLLEVEDDGRGLDDGPPRGTGLGSRLIAAMAQSLSSTVEYDRNYQGCRAVLAGSV